MTGEYGNRTTTLAAFAIALVTPGLSGAQNLADRDTKEVSSYVLTEAALAKYTRAVRNMGQLVKTLPGACDDSEGAKSLNDLAARLDAVPKVKAAMNSAAISSHEYLVFSFSMFQNGMAAWALTQPGGKLPPGTSLANVKFYQAHDAALKKLGEETKPADCDEDNRGNDSDN
jgi:hypothetical protein